LKNRFPNLFRNSLFVLFFALIVCTTATAAAAPARVAILPFDMHAEKDLTFLQEGIMDMLSSRIAYKDQVEVINKSEIRSALAAVEGLEGESRALMVGGKLKADYVLFGSITMFGQSISIDAKMVDVTSQQVPLPFFTQTQGMGDVIPQINQFATNINETVFERVAPTRTRAASPSSTAAVPSPPVQPAPVVDPRMHPEKLLQPGGQPAETVKTPVANPGQAPNPAFTAAPPKTADQADEPAFWKSRNYKKRFNDIAIGDVDGDGANEIVVASHDAVLIYRKIGNVLDQMQEIPADGQATILDVSIGDINGNQIPEIFVSGLSAGRNRAVSHVYEYSGGTFTPVAKKIPYYFNVLTTTTGKVRLFGQKQLTGNADVDASAIYQMAWDKGEYRQGPRMLPAKKANVLGVAYGPLTPGDTNRLVVFDRFNRIRIYDTNGEEVWKSSKTYGGTQKYFLSGREDSMEMENRKYYPLPIKIVDLDNDGKTEFITVESFGLTKNLTKSFRKITDAKFESLAWDGLGLSMKWNSQKTSGHISGFDIGDFDNDGAPELVAVVVLKDGTRIFSDPLCIVIAYDIDTK
jgi:TolB-like protein